MKKTVIFVLIIVSVLFMSCTCKTSNIDDFIVYNEILYKYIGNDEVVRIPGAYYQDGKRMNVTKIEEKAFSNDENIKVVIMPNTVKEISYQSFYNLKNLERIKISKNIEIFSGLSFFQCDKLKYFNYDNNDLSKCIKLKTIKHIHGILKCDFLLNMEDLMLPEGITYIELMHTYLGSNDARVELLRNIPCINESDNLFYLGTKNNKYEYLISYNNDEKYDINDETKLMTNECAKELVCKGSYVNTDYYKIVDDVLYQVKDNRVVYVKNSKDTILTCDEKASIIGIGVYEDTFLDSRDTLIISDNIKKIEEYAFHNASYNKVFIGKNVEYIDSTAFGTCNIKDGIEVHIENQYYKSINGILYTKDGKKLIKSPNRLESDEITIEDGVEVIGEYAFYKTSYKVINVPKTLIEVEDYAFCESFLETFNQITPLKKMGVNSFTGSSIKKIILDDCIDILPEGVFEFCNYLVIDKLPSNLRVIEPYALNTIKEYSDTYFPEKLEIIMNKAFSSSSPYDITIGSKVKYIGEDAFRYNESGDSIKILEDNRYYRFKDGLIIRK